MRSVFPFCDLLVSKYEWSVRLFGRMSKAGANHVTSGNFTFFPNKTFIIYKTFWITCNICILACSASLLRALHEVLNTVFDLFDFFHFRHPFLEMIGKVHLLLCKVKTGIQNLHFLLSKLVKQAKIHLHCDYQVYMKFYFIKKLI